MIIESNGSRFWMDKKLHAQLQKITTKAMKKKDNNKIILVTGDTGVGKSSFAFQCGAVIDPKFSMKSIKFTTDEMKQALKTMHNRFIAFDEAFRGTSGRNVMTKTQKELLQMLYEIRQLNQIVFMITPSLFRLDEAIAVELSDALFYVHKTKGGRRGFRMFNRKKKDMLYYLGKKGKKNYRQVLSLFNGGFANSYVVDEKEYRKQKFESLFMTPEIKPHGNKTDDKLRLRLGISTMALKKELGWSNQQIATYFTEQGSPTNKGRIPEWTRQIA